jgi:hypothetical protein
MTTYTAEINVDVDGQPVALAIRQPNPHVISLAKRAYVRGVRINDRVAQ